MNELALVEHAFTSDELPLIGPRDLGHFTVTPGIAAAGDSRVDYAGVCYHSDDASADLVVFRRGIAQEVEDQVVVQSSIDLVFDHTPRTWPPQVSEPTWQPDVLVVDNEPVRVSALLYANGWAVRWRDARAAFLLVGHECSTGELDLVTFRDPSVVIGRMATEPATAIRTSVQAGDSAQPAEKAMQPASAAQERLPAAWNSWAAQPGW